MQRLLRIGLTSSIVISNLFFFQNCGQTGEIVVQSVDKINPGTLGTLPPDPTANLVNEPPGSTDQDPPDQTTPPVISPLPPVVIDPPGTPDGDPMDPPMPPIEPPVVVVPPVLPPVMPPPVVVVPPVMPPPNLPPVLPPVVIDPPGTPDGDPMNPPMPPIEPPVVVVPPVMPPPPVTPPPVMPPPPIEPPVTPPVPPAQVFTAEISPYNNFICEPFGNQGSTTQKGGLKATLSFINTALVKERDRGSFRAFDFFSAVNINAKKMMVSDKPIYFSQVNTPTRMFDAGFATDSGELLVDSAGNTLIEHFGMVYETVLKLASGDSEGFYELASLGDDGVVVQAMIDNKWQTIIDNDGEHSTTMGCMNRTLEMKMTSQIPLRIYYYQGPRLHIANVLMWRKVRDAKDFAKDVECGKSGNEYFFDPNKNSAQLKPYKDLLQRSWIPIPAANFVLPDNEVNPCSTANTNMISVLPQAKVQDGKATLTVTLTNAFDISGKLGLMEAQNRVTPVSTFSSSNSSLMQNMTFENLLVNKDYLIDITGTSAALNLKVNKQFIMKVRSAPAQ